MSSNIAIKINKLCKCYQIYEKPRDRLLQMIFQGHKNFYREFWALKDVSFEVQKGETVGIIGRNGCGKSTLLQMICGILNPTTGTIQANGRIAALLELGSGFNPEFTGRENVYMNASVLGLRKNEIDERFAEIAAFADIGPFIDRPVKTYSSGMVVRLAFAVAINADPQILVVDEALAVGDELFQRKCYSRINQIKESGSTILFVSHSGAAIVSLCDRAILLDSGKKVTQGVPKVVVGHYQKLLYAPENKKGIILEEIQNIKQEAPLLTRRAGSNVGISVKESYDPHLKPTSTITYASYGAVISEPKILLENGKQVNNLLCGGSYYYEYLVSFYEAASNVRFGMLVKSITGIELGGAASAPLGMGIAYVAQGDCYRVRFKFNAIFNRGTYFLNAGVLGQIDEKEGYLHRLIDIAMFRMLPEKIVYGTGMISIGCSCEIQSERKAD